VKISTVTSQVLSTAREKGIRTYEETARLAFPDTGDRTRSAAERADRRHLCVYPADRSTVLVRVRTDNGYEGIGEAHAPTAPRVVKTIISDLLEPVLHGQDPRSLDVLWERMFSAMRLRSHTQGFALEAIAGVDIALWDLVGKLYGEPVYRLLGGPHRTALRVYSPGVRGGPQKSAAPVSAGFLARGSLR